MTTSAACAVPANAIIGNKLGLFTAVGQGAAAFIDPRSVNGKAAHVADPYTNDQDWAPVPALQIRDI